MGGVKVKALSVLNRCPEEVEKLESIAVQADAAGLPYNAWELRWVAGIIAEMAEHYRSGLEWCGYLETEGSGYHAP